MLSCFESSLCAASNCWESNASDRLVTNPMSSNKIRVSQYQEKIKVLKSLNYALLTDSVVNV